MTRRSRWFPWVALAAGTAACGETSDPVTNYAPFAKPTPDVPRRHLGLSAAQWVEQLDGVGNPEKLLALWALSDLTDQGTVETARRRLVDEAVAVGTQEGLMTALIAIGRLDWEAGPPAPSSVSAVLVALDAPEEGIRRAARQAATAIGRWLVPGLVERLAAPSTRLRWAAAVVLGGMGPAAAEAAPALNELLAGDGDTLVAEQAARALARLGPPGVVLLEAHLLGDVARQRLLATRSLAMLDADALVPLLARRMFDFEAEPDAADWAASVAVERPQLLPRLVDPLVAVLGSDGPAALDAEAALLLVGAPARAALQAVVRSAAGTARADAAQDVLERLDLPSDGLSTDGG